MERMRSILSVFHDTTGAKKAQIDMMTCMSAVQGTSLKAFILKRVTSSTHIASQKPSAMLPLVACYQVGVSESASLAANTKG
eukprot:10969063-Ditylum_brightwellii.AAC.1